MTMPTDIKAAKERLREALETGGIRWAAPVTCDDLRALLAHVDELESASRRAAQQFRLYESEHLKADKLAKAATNAEMAKMLESALTPTPPIEAQAIRPQNRTDADLQHPPGLDGFATSPGPIFPQSAERERIARTIDEVAFSKEAVEYEGGAYESLWQQRRHWALAKADAIMSGKPASLDGEGT